MITAVLLDFYGTLAHARTWGPTREEVLGQRGFQVPADITERWRDEAADGNEHVEHSVSAETYRAWEHARMRGFVEACGFGPDDADLLVEELYTATKSFDLQAYPETAAVLTELRSRNLTVAVCSNWDWHLDRAMAQAGIDELVDVMVTSAQAGARKPHRRIYERTLEAAGITDPTEVLFAGDSWGPDVEGPTAMGMRPVHIWRPEWDGEREPPPPLTDGVVRLPDLTGLLDLL
ncbi:MAG: HAD family hydrolase [Acidimicrobiia bacterium]|nr:HAD family hydrolase [Acidimicrobiia bacterium]